MRPSLLWHAGLAASTLLSRQNRGAGIASFDDTSQLIGCTDEQAEQVKKAHMASARMAVWSHESVSQVLQRRPDQPSQGDNEKIYSYLRWTHTANHIAWLFGFKTFMFDEFQRDVDKLGWSIVPETYKRMAEFFKGGGITERVKGGTEDSLAYLCNPKLFKYHDWNDKDPESKDQGDDAPKLVDRNEAFKEAQKRGHTGMAGVAGRFHYTSDKNYNVCAGENTASIAVTIQGQHMIVLCEGWWARLRNVVESLENVPYMNLPGQPRFGLHELWSSQDVLLHHEHAHAFGTVVKDGAIGWRILDEQARGVEGEQAGELLYWSTDSNGQLVTTDSMTSYPVGAYGLGSCLSLAINLEEGHDNEARTGPQIARANADNYAHFSLALWADGWDWMPDGRPWRMNQLANFRVALTQRAASGS